jgi:iron(III) transport system permease protein
VIDTPRRPAGRSWTISPWTGASIVVALVVLAPFGAVARAAFGGSPDLWSHLAAYVLPAAAADTLVLLAGVGAFVVIVGAGLAWLVTAYDFRGRWLVDGAALLPLAVPTYIIAYAYLDLLHPVGPVQEVVRAVLGYDSPREFRLPDVRSMTGCILLLGVVLYPYVYLPTRAVFMMQAANLFDTARTLGASRREVFFRVALPLARPAVAVGLSLALMETLNDIGAAEFLGVRTLTVSIYTTWVTRSDLAGAAQIALAMLSVVLLLVWIERWARRAQRFANDAQHPRPLAPYRLTGARGAVAFALAALPVAAGFVVPTLYLVHAAATRIGRVGIPNAIWSETLTTVLLSVAATTLTVAAGLVVA